MSFYANGGYNLLSNTMLLGNRQEKIRKGVQIPFLEKRLDENQADLKQAESEFDGTEGKQQERLSVLEKINKAKSNIEELTKAVEYSKNTEYFRHPNIPSSIPDEHVWNDAWYDEKRNGWVTLNQYFFEATNAGDRKIQKEYTQKNITLPGIIIEEEKIQFRFGLPSILSNNTKGQPVWYSLPTLFDVMLTKEIVKGTLYSEGIENAYLYTAGSDAYISILGRYLTEAEYEFAKEFHPFMVKEPLEVVRATSGRQYDEKLYKKQLKQMQKETKEWEKQQKKN